MTVGGMGFIPERLLMMMMIGHKSHVSVTAVSRTGGRQARVKCAEHSIRSILTPGCSSKPGVKKHSPRGPPAGQPCHMHACGSVLAYADKRLTTLVVVF